MDLLSMFFLFALQTFIAVGTTTNDNSKNVHTGIESQIVEAAKQIVPKDLKQLHENAAANSQPVDCSDIYYSKNYNDRKDGIYDIWPQSRVSEGPLRVYCDLQSNDGGWTVIQRRGDYGRNDSFFHKDWNAYKRGFGCVLEDLWIGNDNLFALTNQKKYQLRVNLTAWDGTTSYAIYDEFWIADEKYNYAIHIDGYKGTAGDSLKRHNGSGFSTMDRVNNESERNCALAYGGAWWFENCADSNLNGIYRRGESSRIGDGVIWNTFKGMTYSLRNTVMKIRPLNFR